MNKRIHFILVVGTMALFAGCSNAPEGRVEITSPAADLDFDEVFVKDRDIHLDMPEGVVWAGSASW